MATYDFVSALGVGDPRECRGYVAIPAIVGPGEGTCEVATSDFIPALGVGDRRECRGYVAIPPSLGPPRRHV